MVSSGSSGSSGSSSSSGRSGSCGTPPLTKHLKSTSILLGVCGTFGMSYHFLSSQNPIVDSANSIFGFWSCFFEVRGDDDDTVTQTPQSSYFTWYLQYFHDVGPSYVVSKSTSGLCHRILFRGLGENSKLGGGSFSGGC